MPQHKASTSFEVYKQGGSTREIRMLVDMVLLVRGFRSKVDEELRKIGQSTARMETLAAILNMQGDKSQSDVARRLRIEGATVTRMIDILSKEGLVERTPAPHDRRVNLLSLTPAGVDTVERIFTIYDRVRGHLLEGMSDDQIDELTAVLENMIGRLDVPYADELADEGAPQPSDEIASDVRD
ncbi:MarR family winged helix-turn-helix transcriptional regulator [Aurantiacibacter suaedae]|uniref:MarR family winged helix-turn-helix transcriptional regulator n=1 Tax=Aurantiacibacter suaedae TaxID=2545755 RepID=UPI0010F5289D|nr:MarR family transcriptional regulator [Aurantiacibacter suaedae]